MKIAICDDEPLFVKKLHDILWITSNCSIDCFVSPLQLLEKYQTGVFYDVIFLDILMKPVNGIELAHELRKYDKHAAIIFLTAYPEYAPSGYEVRAFRYLLKPITKESVMQVMRDLHNELTTFRKLLLKTAECELLLSLDDILYVEAQNKDCSIHCVTDTIVLRRGLTDLETDFPRDTFSRIHRKYLVNLSHVREFDESHLTLDNNITLPVSRRKNQAFRVALEKYIERGL